MGGLRCFGVFGSFFGSENENEWSFDEILSGENRFGVGQDIGRFRFRSIQERLPDLLAIKKRLKGLTVENFLGTTWFERCCALEFHWPPCRVKDKVSSDQTIVWMVDHREES